MRTFTLTIAALAMLGTVFGMSVSNPSVGTALAGADGYAASMVPASADQSINEMARTVRAASEQKSGAF